MKPTKAMIDLAGELLAGDELDKCLMNLLDKQQYHVGNKEWATIRLDEYKKLAELVLNVALADHYCEDFVVPINISSDTVQ